MQEALKELDAEGKAHKSKKDAEARTRQNMYNTLVKKFISLVQEYQEMQASPFSVRGCGGRAICAATVNVGELVECARACFQREGACILVQQRERSVTSCKSRGEQEQFLLAAKCQTWV